VPQAVRKQGIESVAVVLKNSYLFPDHEEQVGELAQELGFTQVAPFHAFWDFGVPLLFRGLDTRVELARCWRIEPCRSFLTTLGALLSCAQVSLSSAVMPMVKMVPRGFTAAADAYLTPKILRCAE